MDIEQATVMSIARKGLPMHLPWFPKAIPIRTTIHSSLLNTQNPFSKTSPFDCESLSSARLKVDVAGGSSGSYISTTTTKKANVADHLSLSLGVTADVVLASASVTGGYEQHVQRNTAVRMNSVLITTILMTHVS
jgi:hypothetical protein